MLQSHRERGSCCVLKVSRKDLLYWGTIAIIAFFFLEFFWPMMYSQEQAAPTPSPEAPTTFIGSAIVQAKIMYFSDEAYVFCNSSKANFIKSLESVSGTYKHNGPWAADDFSLYINATNETQDREVIERLNTIISSECGEGSVVMRNAGLNLTIGDVTEKTNITF